MRVVSLLVLAFSVSVAAAADLLPPDRPAEQVIDHYVQERLAKAGVQPAPRVDDAAFLRRAMLDLVGRIPTVGEWREFVADSSADKRIQLVDKLIASPGFARHNAAEFDVFLMYGTKENLREYLATAFRDNRPWDRIYADLILGDESDPARKGTSQFLRTRLSDLDKLTNQASVAFFGVNVSCAQCHDHPLVPTWTQNHFFGMKSFFSRTYDHGTFLGENDYGTVQYKTKNGEAKSATLMFLTGLTIDEPAAAEPDEKEKKKRKEQLEELKKNKQPPPTPAFSRRAKLVEASLADGQREFFARAIVNRLWHRLLGQGLVMPLDQMHPENPPSHPELLSWLARDFIGHGYDLRHLVRGIVLSEAYARSSRWSGAGDSPNAELFAVGQVRPLSPHQYAALLRVATRNPDSFAAAASEEFGKQIESLESSARGMAGRFEQPQEGFQVSVTEALLFSNNARFASELLPDSNESLLGKLKSMSERRELLETLFVAIDSRKPDEDEIRQIGIYLDVRSERPKDALKQLLWAMLTSSECRFNH